MTGRPPPRILTLLLRTLLPREDRDSLQDELRRLYRGRRARDGAWRANLWYLREAWAFAAVSPRTPGTGPGDGPGDLVREARQAVRGLLRVPGFTALAVGTLALGTGAGTLVFGLADAVLIRPLPYDDPDRLVSVWDGWGISRGELAIMQEESRTLSAVGAWADGIGMNVATESGPLRLEGAAVSPELLATLGVQPAVGRLFRPEEARAGAPDAVILSHEVWRERFGGDPGLVGRSLSMDGRPHEVVGVLPAGFAFPTPREQFLVPAVLDPSNAGYHWGWGGHHAVGRLAPGATPDDVRREMLQLHQQMRLANPLWTPEPDARNDGAVLPLHEALVGDVRPVLRVLLGAVAVVLLVACANVANLLLSRGLTRSRDAALRTALGAGRGRILRERLLESLLLAGAGSLAGAVAAAWALALARPFLRTVLPRGGEVGADPRLIAAAMAIAVVSGVAAGALPAWRASRTPPAEALRDGGRGGSGRRRGLSRALVTVQVAAAVVLVTGAGLMARTLGAFSRAETGFDADALTVARVTVGGARFEAGGRQAAFFEELRARLEASGAVEAVAYATTVPFGAGDEYGAFVVDGVTDNPNDLPVLNQFRVSPGYFEAMGIPLLEGRGFTEGDGSDVPGVVVVDRAAADRFWPGESPLGRVVRFPWRGAPPMRVVGVVGSVSDDDLAAAREPAIYLAFAQRPDVRAEFVLRPDEGSGAGPAVEALRAAVADLDAGVPVSLVSPYGALLDRSVSTTRMTTALLAFFAGTALLLGCVGVYGVAAYAVRQRSREFGVRMALGARAAAIRRSVLGEGLLLAVPGAVVGVAAAVFATRFLEGFLYGVERLDGPTFAAVTLLLVAAALAAVYVPARRATRVDPSTALRGD